MTDWELILYVGCFLVGGAISLMLRSFFADHPSEELEDWQRERPNAPPDRPPVGIRSSEDEGREVVGLGGLSQLDDLPPSGELPVKDRPRTQWD